MDVLWLERTSKVAEIRENARINAGGMAAL